MRAVIQRVKSANVKVNDKIIGEIDKGFLVLLGIEKSDTNKDTEYIIKKTINLRVFEDEENKMNKSLKDINGAILLVSQFTLLGDMKKGNRPSFAKAMPHCEAKGFFEGVVDAFKAVYPKIKTGEFAAMMDVALINDGPVTILIDSKKTF